MNLLRELLNIINEAKINGKEIEYESPAGKKYTWTIVKERGNFVMVHRKSDAGKDEWSVFRVMSETYAKLVADIGGGIGEVEATSHFEHIIDKVKNKND